MNKAALLLIFLCLEACKEISFREPQPTGRRAFHSVPKKLQGKYLTFLENGELSKDTVVILPHGYRFGYFDEIPLPDHHDPYEEGSLSDTLVLKFYKGYYFLNRYENPEWLLRVIKPEKNGDLIYMAMEQDDVNFKDYVKKLSAEIRIDSIVMEKKTLYHINPTPSQLIALIEKGYFSKTILKKIRP